jgi:glycosyltransferase involved in cell wall biosynthesis
LLHRYRPDARTAAFTMWETDTLPPKSVPQLNRCGLVIVPSSWGARSFRDNGVTVPISVVPLGYDPTLFATSDGDRSRGACVFGTAGALDEGGLRKNVQRVIDLFRQAFPTGSGVRLRVKITPNSPPVNTHGDSRVDVLAGHLDPPMLAAWYRSLDAYVNASAGEGFGLHLLEAMACGVPLISSTFGGVGAFFDGRVGYEVKYRPVGAWNSIYRGTWSDPDDGDILANMRRVYQRREESRQRGRAAAERARQFRWEDTIRKLVIVLIQNGFITCRQPR